jgi:hypothetical protein
MTNKVTIPQKKQTCFDVIVDRLKVILPFYTDVFAKNKVLINNIAKIKENGVAKLQLSLDEDIRPYVLNADGNYKLNAIYFRNIFASFECEKIEIVKESNPSPATSRRVDRGAEFAFKITLKEKHCIYYDEWALNRVSLTDFYIQDPNSNIVINISGDYFIHPNQKMTTNNKEILLIIDKQIAGIDRMEVMCCQKNILDEIQIDNDNLKARLVYNFVRRNITARNVFDKFSYNGLKSFADIEISQDGKQIKYKILEVDGEPIIVENMPSEILIDDTIEFFTDDVNNFLIRAFESDNNNSDILNNLIKPKIIIFPEENIAMARSNASGVDNFEDIIKQRQSGFTVLICLPIDKDKNYITDKDKRKAMFNLCHNEIIDGINMALNGYTISLTESFIPFYTTITNMRHAIFSPEQNSDLFLYEMNFKFTYETEQIKNDNYNPSYPVKHIKGYVVANDIFNNNTHF